MIKYTSQHQLKFDQFSSLYQLNLDPSNRWIQLASIMPWDDMVKHWTSQYSKSMGAAGINPRILLGAMIIKHKLNLTDEQTILIISENPYMQFFLGLEEFNPKPLFSATLFVDIRKKIGSQTFDQLSELVIKLSQIGKNNKDTANHGELKIDATVADQQIRYPNDLGLLNEARVKTEIIIDELFDLLRDKLDVKPRTYRREAHKVYLTQAKKKRKTKKELRKALRNGLNCVKRNLGHINTMLDMLPGSFPIAHKYQKQLWVIHTLWDQQWDMFINHRKRCNHRIVSISQPHVRPIVRGKQAAMVEFGSKLGLSLFNGYLKADNISWDAYHEAQDLIQQAENYKTLLGYYPEIIMADKLYATNKNRKWCKENGVRLTATPKGKQKKKTAYQKRKQRKEYGRRNHIEGKIGNAKQAYNLNQIKAKLKQTSESWIGATIFVMNLAQFANLNGATF